MTFRALAMLGLVILSGTAAAAAEPGGPPFSFWLDYGASAVSHESESLTVDDLTLGSEYGLRLGDSDLAVVLVSELSSLHFALEAKMPARTGFAVGGGLSYLGRVRVGVGAEGGFAYGNKWELGHDSSGFPTIETESMWLTAEFVRAAVPLAPVGSWRIALCAQFQARQYGDGTSSLSGLVGVAFGD